MKKVLYLLIVILSISCSKNDDEQPAPLIANTPDPLYELLKEYKIENIFDTNTVEISPFNGHFIFISGQLKNSQNFGFIGFETITKEKLFDLTTFEYTSITVDLPYGEKKSFEVSKIKVFGFAENSSKSKVVYLGVSDGSKYHEISYIYYINYIYFINGNEITYVINPNLYDAEYNRISDIIIWDQNFLVVNGNSNNFTLYSPTGEIITEGLIGVYPSPLYSPLYYPCPFSVLWEGKHTFDIINEFEAIIIYSIWGDNGICYISKLNLRENDDIWSIELLSKLNKPRIDSAKLIEKSDTHFTYELHYTEYSGNKGVIKFKINIATGEIEYL